MRYPKGARKPQGTVVPHPKIASPRGTAGRLGAEPSFCDGIELYAAPWPGFDTLGRAAAIPPGQTSVPDPSSPAAVFQTLLAADALRYLALQITGTKASGHPGGFASSADLYAALVMLGHTNIVTEAGHHAPGFYAAMFLDTSLEEMGIRTVRQLCDRFRERHGLLGHLSGAIPGILSPAGPLGQGQHFAMAGALLHPDVLIPLTLGDGGLGEPYILSSMMHFHTSFPDVTNFLPCLVWNGYSQEHHAMVSCLSNEQMERYWKGHGFDQVLIVDAKQFDDRNQPGPYVDSTRFSLQRRLAFAGAILEGLHRASELALQGRLTAFIVKQLKGSGTHRSGARSHSLGPADTLQTPEIADAMRRRALPPAAWQLVRDNFRRAGGGPCARTSVIEKVLRLPPLRPLPLHEFTPGQRSVPTSAVGDLIVAVGESDPRFVVTNADGNAASGVGQVNRALKIRHPTRDESYDQDPLGRVYEPVSEDACAGLAMAVALFGGRSLWLSYQSFAVNGVPIWQTVCQAMAELRRKTPSSVALFTAGALEQGRNGWTHQRPEIDGYLAAATRSGNVFPLYPCDANMAQVAYEWALETCNKGIVITTSKTPLPIYTTLDQGREALLKGALALYESAHPGRGPTVVLACLGDMILLPVFEAVEALERFGFYVRVVSVVNPRRLYRPSEVAWSAATEPDNIFLGDDPFHALFDGDILVGVSGGPAAPLEPVMMRSRAPKRTVACWRRGDTAACTNEMLEVNGLDADTLVSKIVAAADSADGFVATPAEPPTRMLRS